MNEEKENIIDSLEQLMTTSCILAGFTFSGLLAIPSIDKEVFAKLIQYLHGNVDRTLVFSHYLLFLSTILFLGTIIPIIVYKGTHYQITLKRLKRILLVANMLFSFAIAGLLAAVVIFGIPNNTGLFLGIGMGIFLALNFLYENINPIRTKSRTRQIELEENEFLKKSASSNLSTTPKTSEKNNAVSKEVTTPSVESSPSPENAAKETNG